MKKQFKIYLLFFLIILNGIIIFSFYEKSDRNLTVSFLDVGQGDAIFIRTPSGKQMLVDGGAPGGAVLRELGRVMPFYDRSIDVVVVTHSDQDHLGGLVDVLERFSVDHFIRTAATSTSVLFQTVMKNIELKKIKQEIITSPKDIDFSDGVSFEIIFPDQNTSSWETNDSSIVGRITYGQRSFLLTGDSPIKTEKYLVETYKNLFKSDVLKVGHHGSKNSSSVNYIQEVSPIYSVISAGLNNHFGHPTEEVINTLKKFNSKIVETLGKGSIIFKTDGENLILLTPLSLR